MLVHHLLTRSVRFAHNNRPRSRNSSVAFFMRNPIIEYSSHIPVWSEFLWLSLKIRTHSHNWPVALKLLRPVDNELSLGYRFFTYSTHCFSGQIYSNGTDRIIIWFWNFHRAYFVTKKFGCWIFSPRFFFVLFEKTVTVSAVAQYVREKSSSTTNNHGCSYRKPPY